uniref:NADH-ubiquinone oxidoreductase chain 2 n=1 Tax=Agrilinae sp. 2 ACP-2013 TaxID=1434405 RepID=A0A3G4RY77_9COLE|nr:NADH dehydrogenase subunit 2 [Agrilinae sp. 2 ACP-2013]
MMNLYKMLFFLMLMLGTIISISSKSWLGVWMGLEINLLSIIPLTNNSKEPWSTEASMKYFITQAVASMILLMGILTENLWENLLMKNFYEWQMMSNMFITTALLMKMGAAPFHFWFPEVMEGLSWMSNLIMMTWQKIAPMITLMYVNFYETFIVMVILTSTMTGSILGLNQTSMRKMLTFSSINHMGWMLAILMFNETMWIWYFIIYSMMNVLLTYMMSKMNINLISQFMETEKIDYSSKMFLSMNLFSLGGIPPFIGFLPKWFTIQALIMNKMFLMTTIMIILTLITLYFYMRITLMMVSMMNSKSITFKTGKNKKMKKTSTMNFMFLVSLIISTLILTWK